MDAKDKRDQGIEQSSETAGIEWKEYAIAFLRYYCQTHMEVFVDNLWRDGLKKPNSPRALGAVMQHAVKEGWLVEQKVNGCVLARPSVRSNMQLKRVWRSTLCKQEQQNLF